MNRKTVSGFAAAAVAGPLMALGWGLGWGQATSAADDAGTYSGTDCGAGQFFDASTQTCSSSVVTNDPGAVPQQKGPGIDGYGGVKCPEGQDFDASAQACTPTVVTNDPQSAVPLQGEDPAEYSVPTVGNIPGCAAEQKGGQGAGTDPFGLCR